MKILYYFCGEGLGHSTRTLAAGTVLAQEHDVTFASYGSARDFVSARNLPVQEVPSEIKLVGKAGALDIRTSIASSLQKLDAQSVLRHDRFLKKHKPDLVISDSVFLPVALAKARRIPVWMILNQTNVDRFFADREAPVRWIGNAVKQINYSVLGTVDRILVPDFPRPFTLCEKNISLSSELDRKTHYIGPLVQKNASDMNAAPVKPPCVLALVRGFAEDSGMAEKFVRVARAMPDFNFDLLADKGVSLASPPRNLKLHSSIPDLISSMARASVVLCGGGHSTLMEAICLGKPVLSLPYAFHFEQESNADQLQALGLGTRIDYRTSEMALRELIEEHAQDRGMRRRLERMKRLAVEEDGRKHLVRMVREFGEGKR